MCTLAVYLRTAGQWPLIVAANRDEFFERPSTPPRVIAHDPWVVAGQDLHAGGTWLGLNQRNLVVGLLNRTQRGGPDPNRRSRGLLCLECLQTDSATAAAQLAAGQSADRYNGFNLLAADPSSAFVVTNHGGRMSSIALERGVHVLTNADVNDATCPRIAHSHRMFAAVQTGEAAALDSLCPQLADVLSDHAVDPGRGVEAALCIHRDTYGTRSSSIIAVDGRGGASYRHAVGPPCVTPYFVVPLPG